MKKAQGSKSQRGGLLIRGAAIVLACTLVAAAWSEIRAARHNGGVDLQSAPSVADSQPAASVAGSNPAPPEWRYDAVVQRNLFLPRSARQQAEPPALPPLEPMPIDVFTLRGLDEADEEPAPHLAPWTYAGYATVDDTPVAIVENADNGQAEFLRAGDTLDGFVVREIAPEAIHLTRGGEVAALPLSDAFTATPLNEPPRPREAARAPGGRGAGGVPGDRAGRTEFLQRVLPALRDNPELAEQARLFMQNVMRPEGPWGSGPPPWMALPPEGGLP